MPRSIAARTSVKPGSLMPGVPPSVTTATSLPCSSSRSSFSPATASLWSWNGIWWVSMPKCFSRTPVLRVSSAATRSTLFRTSIARAGMSPRLPIGVATR
jgi:hypothetical protein